MDYESTFIFSPQLPADKVEELTAKVVKTIETSQGIVKTIQQLGKRRLSYYINKFSEGSYVYMELSGAADMVKALESFCKFNDSVIRFLIVKIEKKKVIAKPAKAKITQTKSQKSEITQTKSQKAEITQTQTKITQTKSQETENTQTKSQESEITHTKSQEMEVQNGPTTKQSALT
jgi:small subunit ribosomal protein S6